MITKVLCYHQSYSSECNHSQVDAVLEQVAFKFSVSVASASRHSFRSRSDRRNIHKYNKDFCIRCVAGYVIRS